MSLDVFPCPRFSHVVQQGMLSYYFVFIRHIFHRSIVGSALPSATANLFGNRFRHRDYLAREPQISSVIRLLSQGVLGNIGQFYRSRSGKVRDKGPAGTNRDSPLLTPGEFLWRFRVFTNPHCPRIAVFSLLRLARKPVQIILGRAAKSFDEADPRVHQKARNDETTNSA